ncbi:MAG: hypothetical protein R3B53_04265 [Candidatus Paceibacterota bacterium]
MEKLKSLLRNDQIFYGLLVILVGIGSFLLGQQSVANNIPENKDFNRIEIVSRPKTASNQTANVITPTVETGNTTFPLVASKAGTKYHLATCPGAKQIKPDNVIYFETQVEAEAAGYTKAANCPGL